MTTPAKLFGRDISEYDEVDVDELLAKLTQEELTMLAKEVDPDDNFLPPCQRNNYECEKDPTGPLNRRKLIEHINKQAMETPDRPEVKPYVAGVVRGKKWIPPPPPKLMQDAEEQINIDLGEEYDAALNTASQEEIIDLAAILGFHSMMNQDQYHASLLNKGQPVGLGWDGITKATKPKIFPMDPPNDTDPDDTVTRVQNNDEKLNDLNWNNIKNISDEKFEKLFAALKTNTNLEVLSLVNVGLNDRTAALLADALTCSRLRRASKDKKFGIHQPVHRTVAKRVVNVETNFISPAGVVQLVRSLLETKTVEEFRASNQRSSVLGNKIEMEITSLVEQNPTLLRLGLHLEYSDARHRVASHLQRNIDRSMYTGVYKCSAHSYTGSNKIEMEITSLVEQNPTLLRLGLHLEYSDARHRVASHLQRNIDRSMYTGVYKCSGRSYIRYMVIIMGHFASNCRPLQDVGHPQNYSLTMLEQVV
ncbi:tropomodulin domain-containing protein [Phthorimaea operculella]|nr:tropomodulin domain-containing protein [Phthorimaea operculella]